MKPQLIARLDLLAAEREARLRDTLRSQATALMQSRQQCELLEAYRGRLAASWQDGRAIPAAEARRASHFSAGAQAAAAQIAATEAAASARLQSAADDLARLGAYRRKLAAKLTAATRAAAAAAEQKAERARPWRPA
ncbi:hypothetical protein [Acidocella sp.]|uniref:hypothetical protein n=1 Tax=Acidocella sp. TaxID=50710 RepID=UPI002630D439|nr:hypothetical protein [Acidocella sp.]